VTSDLLSNPRDERDIISSLRPHNLVPGVLELRQREEAHHIPCFLPSHLSDHEDLRHLLSSAELNLRQLELRLPNPIIDCSQLQGTDGPESANETPGIPL